MYKKQMTAQRVICLLSIIASVIVFLYSLGLMTDLYDSLYPTMLNPYDLTDTDVPGSIIYYDMQPFNRALLRVSIGLILLSCLLFITNTNVRRKYYVGNYAAVAVVAAGGAAFSVWAHGEIEMYKAQFLQINFEELAANAAKKKSLYTESTFWFDAHYVVFGLLLLGIALLIANVIWKRKLMKEERALIEQGKGAAA